ncbi:MAG: hypothetical protein RR835_08620 [Peptostreptococcaceae bacterium]
MGIKLYELKKVITSPVVIILTVLMILLNFYIVKDKTSYRRDDINIVNDIIGEFGHEINDESINTINDKYEEEFKRFNNLVEKELGKIYEYVGDFFNSEEYAMHIEYKNKFSEEDIQFFNELRVLELYAHLVTEQIEEYENINFSNNSIEKGKARGLEGKALDIAVDRYEVAQSVFEETIDNEDHKNIYPLGEYWFQSVVFQDIFFPCVLEIMIITVLITSYLVNYEFDNKTNLVVYSTKRGRNNTKDKLFVSLVSSVIISALILGFTMLSLALNMNIMNILDTSVRNAFNWEGPLPYVFWFDISVGMQLALTIIIILICSALFSLITFIITKLVKNSYTSFFIFFIIFGVFVIIPSIPSKSSTMYMYMYYDIFNLIIKPGSFFMVRSPLIVDKFYEVKTLGIWTVMLAILSTLSFLRFKKEGIN